MQIAVAILGILIIAVLVIAWRRHRDSPVVLMAIVATLIVWQDPVMNWASYAVYNPSLWHGPKDWPLVSISPTVEPFIVIGHVTFFLGP